jgi:hypothetical protein
MLCLACFTSLQSRMGVCGKVVNCPTCRAPTDFKILLELVNASNDKQALEACAAYQRRMREKVIALPGVAKPSGNANRGPFRLQHVKRANPVQSAQVRPEVGMSHAPGCRIFNYFICDCGVYPSANGPRGSRPSASRESLLDRTLVRIQRETDLMVLRDRIHSDECIESNSRGRICDCPQKTYSESDFCRGQCLCAGAPPGVRHFGERIK